MYKIVFSLIIIIAASFACKKLGYDDDPNDIASSGEYISDTLFAISDSVIQRTPIYTGFSEKFSLGQRDGLSAGFLVYFSFLDTVSNIDSVSVKFTTVNSYGADMVDKISTNIYSVDSIWGGAANQYNRYRNPPTEKMEFVTRGLFNTKDSSTTSFNIPLDFNNIWIGRNDSLADTVRFSLFFEPETGNENAIVELGSYLSTQNPILIYRKNSQDTTVIDTVNALLGASIYNYNETMGRAFDYSDENVIISSGIVKNSLFKFDFSTLPANAIYYRALLELSEDEINDYENSKNKSSLVLQTVESYADTVYNPTLTFLMTSDDGFAKTSGSSTLSFAENFLQSLANNNVEHDWLEVAFLTPDEDFSIKKFWGVNSMDPEKRPKLIINYLNANK